MRPRHPFLVWLATLVLLGAVVGTTAAQDQQGIATHVTGISPGGRTVSEGAPAEGALGVRGAIYEHVIEWSDPRLPALLRFDENYDVRLAGDGIGAIISLVSTVRLDGPEGWWTGLEYGLIEERGPESTATRLIVLEGAGAYDGLSAMLTHSTEDGDYSKPVFDGYIFDGEMTPTPTALEAFDVVADVAPDAAPEPEPSAVSE